MIRAGSAVYRSVKSLSRRQELAATIGGAVLTQPPRKRREPFRCIGFAVWKIPPKIGVAGHCKIREISAHNSVRKKDFFTTTNRATTSTYLPIFPPVEKRA
jgi:hypothetical protein